MCRHALSLSPLHNNTGIIMQSPPTSFQKYIAGLMLCFVLLVQILVVPAQAFLGLGEFGIADEKELGRKFEVLIRSKLPLVEDPEVSLYVKGIMEKISDVIPPQPFEFTSGVILHNSLNAFAVPGGHIFIFTGLLMQLDNEAELAGIIAHEMAHVTQRHVAARMERASYITLASLLLAIAGVAAGGEGGSALAAGALGAGQSAMLNYSRIDESDADDIGYQYLVAAGYPPMGMAGGFKKIREKSILSGGGTVPTYLSTHPEIGSRITSVLAKVQSGPKALQNRQIDNTRFKRVQTLLWARYGNTQAAQHRFENKKDGLSLMALAMVQARENQIQKASATFDKAIAAAPKDPLVLREAGTFHYRKGDVQKANTLLRASMQLDPRDYMAQFFYARLMDAMGQGDNAAHFYKEVLRALPYDSEVHTAYGRSLGTNGQEFLAYLHLAYGALYQNSKKKTKQYREKAQNFAKNSKEKQSLSRFDKIYEERKEIWEEGL